jgi:pimeloyl-ACP methyl ester carboxylesterase
VEFTDFGGQGPGLHFAHANAYPPGSYRQMLDPLLESYRTRSIHWLPLVKPDHHPHFRDWHELIPDLIEFIESEFEPPIFAAGHSMGAVVTMMAAVRRPDLFRAIVLIDPVLLPLTKTLPLGLAPERWKRRLPIIAKALSRPNHWNSREAAFAFHRRARAFAGVGDDALWDYIRAGTRETGDGGYTLSFPREWEAKIYATCPWVWPELKRCRVPMLGMRGSGSEVVSGPVWDRWQRIRADAEFIEIDDAGHLLPLEKPARAAQVLSSFLETMERHTAPPHR